MFSDMYQVKEGLSRRKVALETFIIRDYQDIATRVISHFLGAVVDYVSKGRGSFTFPAYGSEKVVTLYRGWEPKYKTLNKLERGYLDNVEVSNTKFRSPILRLDIPNALYNREVFVKIPRDMYDEMIDGVNTGRPAIPISVGLKHFTPYIASLYPELTVRSVRRIIMAGLRLILKETYNGEYITSTSGYSKQTISFFTGPRRVIKRLKYTPRNTIKREAWKKANP